MKTKDGHMIHDDPQNRSGGPHLGESTPPVDSPHFCTFDDFLHIFGVKQMSLRQQLRFIKKHQSEIVDIEDSQRLTNYFARVVRQLLEEVSIIGPIDTDQAVAGIDYVYTKNHPLYKKGDIIITPRIIDLIKDTPEAQPIEFLCFRSARKLTEAHFQTLQNHLVEMVNLGFCLEEELSKWLYFLGATQHFDDDARLNEKLLFLGSVKMLMFWIRALYGLMHYHLPTPMETLAAGYYQLSPIIVTPNGSGVSQKAVSGDPTTRDPFIRIVANSVRLRDRDLQPRSLTTTTEPSLNDAALLIHLLQPLGCHLVA